MGYAHILYIYNDGIRDAGRDLETLHRMIAAVGAGVLKVSLFPEKERTGDRFTRVKDCEVLNHGNCINWVDEVHSRAQRLYWWDRNYLRPLRELGYEELLQVKAVVDEALVQKRS